MKAVILKYALDEKTTPPLSEIGPGVRFKITMRKGASILTFRLQKSIGYCCMWCLCDPKQQELEERTFIVVYTGQPFNISEAKYIGSELLRDGNTVLHLWEIL